MNNNFNLKSFLAEGRLLNEDTQVDENLIKSIFDEKVQDDYKPLIGTDPIYDGLEEVLNLPETFQKVVELVKENGDEDEEMAKTYAYDATDRIIMEIFTPRLIQNLIKVGFTYDRNEDSWTVPENYSNKTDSNELTSYGIIWDIWDVDYDTSPREFIGEFLADAAQEQA